MRRTNAGPGDVAVWGIPTETIRATAPNTSKDLPCKRSRRVMVSLTTGGRGAASAGRKYYGESPRRLHPFCSRIGLCPLETSSGLCCVAGQIWLALSSEDCCAGHRSLVCRYPLRPVMLTPVGVISIATRNTRSPLGKLLRTEPILLDMYGMTAEYRLPHS